MFYYLMKLHYSQTRFEGFALRILFYYLMKLHYSQTVEPKHSYQYSFYYLMKLHYSQTEGYFLYVENEVLLPYEITLLSNLK